MNTKICPSCNDEKETTHEFWNRNRARPDGLQTYCKPCQRQKSSDSYINNREAITNRRETYRRNLKLRVVRHYSGGDSCCECCGEIELMFLTIDHIDGGGNQHRKEEGIRGGNSTYWWLIRNGFPEGFRVLCFNCNQVLGCYGYCPHQKAS